MFISNFFTYVTSTSPPRTFCFEFQNQENIYTNSYQNYSNKNKCKEKSETNKNPFL